MKRKRPNRTIEPIFINQKVFREHKMINLIIIIVALVGLSIVFEIYLKYKTKKVKCRYVGKPIKMRK